MRGAEGRIPTRFIVIVVFSILASAILSSNITNYMTRNALRASILKDNKQKSTLLPEDTTTAQVLSMCSALIEKEGGDSSRDKIRTSGQDAVPSIAPPPPPCAGANTPAQSEASTPVPLIEFPQGISNVIINIGTNYNPIMPPEDDPTTVVLAVEPILETAARIKKHPRLFIILAAIAGGQSRFQTMQVHNVGGASSSLAAPTNKNAFWVGTKNDGWPSHQIVPVMSMQTLLESIPRNITIKHLKTDMQGFDFVAVSSAGRMIRRIPEVYAEVYVNTASYEGVHNDLYKDWEPHMKAMGYERTSNNVKKRGEDNALWVRVGQEEQ